MTSVADAIRILLTADGTQAVNEFKKVGAAADQNLKKAEAGSQKLGSTLTKVGVGAAVTGIAIGAGLFKAAEAASEADLAQQKLLNTIKNSPSLVGANVEAFNKQADALEKTTIYSHVTTTSVQAMLGMFKLNQDQILQLTPLVEDFASKFGIDVVTAARAVGKALEGNAGLLNRYGIITGITKKTTNDYARVLQGLSVVQGFAATQGKTFSGQLQITKNEMKRVEEEIGVGAMPVLKDLVGIIGVGAKAFSGLNDITRGGVGELAAWTSVALIAGGAVSTVAGLVIKLSTQYGVLKDKLGGAKTAAEETAVADDTLATAEATAAASTETLGTAAIASTAEIGTMGSAVTGLSGLVGGLAIAGASAGIVLGGMWDSANSKGHKANDDFLQGMMKAQDAVRGTKISVDDLASEWKKLSGDKNATKDFLNWAHAAGLTQTQIESLAAAFGVKLPPATKTASGAVKDAGSSAKTAADHYYALRTAVDAATTAMFNQGTARDKFQKDILSLGDDTQTLKDDTKAFYDELKKSGPSSDATHSAYRKIQEDQLQLSGDYQQNKQDAIDWAVSMTSGAKDASDAIKNHASDFVTNLQKIANGLTPGSPTRVFLEQYITRLKTGIPKSVLTAIGLDTTPAETALHNFETQLQQLGAQSTAVQIHGTIGIHGNTAGNVQTFDSGGWVKGAPGAAVPAVVHGGEFVLSRDMLAGRKSIGLRSAGGGDTYVTQHITITNPDPKAVVDALNRAALNGTRPNSRVLTGV